MKINLEKTDIRKTLQYYLTGLLGVKKRSFQSMVLFVSWIITMGLNFLGSILTTKILGPSGYGDYKFAQTIWAFLTLLLSFGLLQSGSRIVLLEKEATSVKKAVGMVLIIGLGMGLLMSLITIIIAYPIDYFLHTKLAMLLIILSPLVIGSTLSDALELTLQSTNQISFLAALHVFPSLLYVIVLYTISRLTTLNTLITLFLQLITYVVVIAIIIFLLRPRLGSFRYYWEKIRKENKTYGFPIYTGMMATYATSYINRLSISYWVGNTSIGFFSLATTITDPLKFIPNAAGTSSFQSFAEQEKIPRNIFWVMIITSLLTLAAGFLLFGPLLAWFYPKGFYSVGSMARVLAFGAVAQGLGDFYNRFLGAHGKGKQLRNVSYLVGAVNLVGIIFLTPFLGVNGVVITTVLAGLANMIFMIISYRKYVRSKALVVAPSQS